MAATVRMMYQMQTPALIGLQHDGLRGLASAEELPKRISDFS